jgi:hypothetical protein
MLFVNDNACLIDCENCLNTFASALLANVKVLVKLLTNEAIRLPRLPILMALPSVLDNENRLPATLLAGSVRDGNLCLILPLAMLLDDDMAFVCIFI